MKLNVYKIDGTKTNEKVTLSPEVFEIEPNDHVVYLAAKAYLANNRQGTHSVKTRSAVAGGGGKPFRQKGTGRARQGTIRAPHMVGGGRAHGPHPRDYTQTVPKKVLKLAKKSVLSDLAKRERLVILEDFSFDEPKTRNFADILRKLDIDTTKVLMVTSDLDKNLVLSARNVPYAQIKKAPEFSIYDLLNANYLLLQKGAVEIVNEVFV